MKDCLGLWVRKLVEYETPRYVKIHNPLLGIVLRLSQFGIITYIVSYALIYERGYQETAGIETSVITKVKGTTSSKLERKSHSESENIKLYERVWDEADYVVPPAENGAFFITTNLNVTPNQTQSLCGEDPLVEGSRCRMGLNQCRAGHSLLRGHGKLTGKCLPLAGLGEVYDGVCEIAAWCPLELDTPPYDPPVIQEADQFTVYIKNSIAFPHFGDEFRKNNVRGGKPTFFHPQKNPLGQIFRIGEIVELAGGNFTTVAVRGGVISITIIWRCDLDWDFDLFCNPRYRFGVLEDSGWNFRHAYYHDVNRRTLIKAYGLKFIIQVDGVGSKFSMKNTVLNIGNGLALLGIATVLCELVIMHFIEEKQTVNQKKYDSVEPLSHIMKNIITPREIVRTKV